ncbi:MAG: hypothetical protein C0622_04870 [Desulfuromonas sp.]|nr:MAG: hypothetical protein C0622_04870 [Desulfuromonas sp.]
MRCFAWILLPLLLVLSACFAPISSEPTVVTNANGFSESMRWGDFPTAAFYLHPDVREDFKSKFVDGDSALHIVESQVLTADLHEDEGWAETVYEMEYFRLPSGQVKKWRWSQHWKVEKDGPLSSANWLIDNAPPAVPWTP